MTTATRDWLTYTDGLLAREDDTSKEIKLIMGVTRGPDYVRLRGGVISPRLEDRKAVKLVTTAVLRAKFFPRAAAVASKATQFISELQTRYGVTAKKAAAMAEIADIKPGSNWLVAPNGTFASQQVLDEQLGAESHFSIKVKQAAALLGIYRS